MGTTCKLVSVLILLAFIAPCGSVIADMDESDEVTLEFTQLNVLKMTNKMVLSGVETAGFRQSMDTDNDGTVSTEEANVIKDFFTSEDDPEINLTLDGKKPTNVDADVSLSGLEGANDSTEDITIEIIMTVTYPEPEDKDTHTISWPEGEGPGGDDDDSLWENKTSVTLKVICPSGWKFDTEGWPAGTSDYLKSDDTVIEISGATEPANFDDTFGALDSLVIKKKDSGDDDDDSPGFGLVIALVAVSLAALAVRRR